MNAPTIVIGEDVAAKINAQVGAALGPIDCDVIRARLGELVDLYTDAGEARDALAAAIEAAAKAARIEPKALRSFLTARCGKDPNKKRREADQLAFLFEEIGR